MPPDRHRSAPWPADLDDRLKVADRRADLEGRWSEVLWSTLADAGLSRWALPTDLGGPGWDRVALLDRYERLARSSLVAAFVLTQHDAAVRRLVASSTTAANDWLRRVADGSAFVTVGLSQLTTSRRLGAQALVARPGASGTFVFDGAMPWVTAAGRADAIVAGAVLEDGRQLLAIVRRQSQGLTVAEPFRLMALGASETTEIRCRGVVVRPEDVLAGPSPDVMATPGHGGTGGLETSALAIGQARVALDGLATEAANCPDLAEPLAALEATWADVQSDLEAVAVGQSGSAGASGVRGRANALVLAATQAYLTARRGSGYLLDEPAQQWARQALFFLVWSCPSPVAHAALRDFAGLCPA